MTERRQNLIEGIGLLFVLFSFLIQLIETGIESDVREAQFYQTQEKLDRLWGLAASDYAKKHPELNIHYMADFENMSKGWKNYSTNKEYLDSWQKGVYFEGISNSRVWIFLIGSIFILIPKFTKRR